LYQYDISSTGLSFPIKIFMGAIIVVTSIVWGENPILRIIWAYGLFPKSFGS